MINKYYILFQLHLNSVPEDAESDEENGQETLKTPLSNARVPSQKSRAMLVRTPAAREQGTSPINFTKTLNEEEDTQILITELRDYTEEEKLEYVEQKDESEDDAEEAQQEEEEVKEKEVFEEKIETFRDEDYDTDLEVEGMCSLLILNNILIQTGITPMSSM